MTGIADWKTHLTRRDRCHLMAIGIQTPTAFAVHRMHQLQLGETHGFEVCPICCAIAKKLLAAGFEDGWTFFDEGVSAPEPMPYPDDFNMEDYRDD